MKLDLDYHNRQIIPRWLPYNKKSLVDTQREVKLDAPTENEIIQYIKLKDDWKLNKNSMSIAIQLVATADMLNLTDDEYYREALSFIENHKNLIKGNKLIEDFLFPDDNSDNFDSKNISPSNRKLIKEIKRKLLVYINDPILWIDLAYYYTISCCNKKAEKCIRIALNLNNYNPHVIRSAVRYFVFCQEPERALHILRKSPNLLINPLLLSAEISVAEAFDFKTNNIKRGIALLHEQTQSSNNLAELNASIATIECNFGNLKKGKKLINNALITPNENTLAQIQYLSNRNNFVFTPQQFEVPCRFEADALNYLYTYQYKEVIAETRKWFDFHPFSSRPAVLNSFVNSTIFNEYEKAISIIDESLKLLPANSLLLNNKAFALAKSGRTNEAMDCIKAIQSSGINEFDDIDKNTLKATSGLIAYRSGNPEEGRRLYKEAVEYFDKIGNFTLKARALFFWAEEEERFNKMESEKILLNVIDIAKKNNVQEVKILLEEKKALQGL
jgi:tetratricopeptide (TPR) repeat protein